MLQPAKRYVENFWLYQYYIDQVKRIIELTGEEQSDLEAHKRYLEQKSKEVMPLPEGH